MSKDNGGPAFPWNGEMNRDLQELSGMTLRDYFAAKAMQGLIAQSVGSAFSSDSKEGAAYAYRFADAMLAERNKS